ncbi:EVE domain-containing protein [Frankineae bacterium MT45]|nr:EVE domain-containing protein [Frankineae bacterium MT45]
MANHGKRAPLARMKPGDRVLVYSPKTDFPNGDPFKAIAIVGVVTGAEPEPSALIPGGFRLRADLREIEPITLEQVRDVLPTSRIRFGFFELPTDDADTVWKLVPDA